MYICFTYFSASYCNFMVFHFFIFQVDANHWQTCLDVDPENNSWWVEYENSCVEIACCTPFNIAPGFFFAGSWNQGNQGPALGMHHLTRYFPVIWCLLEYSLPRANMRFMFDRSHCPTQIINDSLPIVKGLLGRLFWSFLFRWKGSWICLYSRLINLIRPRIVFFGEVLAQIAQVAWDQPMVGCFWFAGWFKPNFYRESGSE